MSIRIVTDSTCDLPQEVIQKYGIAVAPLFINVGEESYLDGIELSRQEFYTKLPDYPQHPTTGTPGTERFKQLYRGLTEEGASEIFSIHISKSLSGTVDVARSAAAEFKGAPVTVLDARQLSLGVGFVVEQAAKMAEAGLKREVILMALEDQIKRTRVFAALDTLEFLRRSGRMNRFVVGLGSLLQLKPILTMYDGQPGSEQVRTRAKALARVAEMVRESAPLERAALLHANAPEEAEALRQAVAELLPPGELYSMNITPVLGAHIGPGAVGFAVVSKEVKMS
jgi:DegV family protein with EDD domain